ncbi:ComF family protein [Tenacibaculum caenipelagi]|uniref:ComF family protein n=1 Tax=Tenacibaculum caenipelagi TaxID=1325435 RepID=A0A4R6TH45_9FLAO|nr:ComF family protein [Tenacibaculum caenipelagi]TDQ28530.1 ComF family protein [Tenacibaculum caenipelagi]
MQFLKDIFYLFYPNLCVNCKIVLLPNEQFLCIACKNELPIIDDNEYVNVTLTSTFYGRVPVQNVRSFLYYQKGGITQKLIHQLKYKNQADIGSFIGDWFGSQLKESKIFNNVDYIVPVPLHPKRQKKRGYNQVTLFGNSLSETLNIEYKPNILLRTSIAKTQSLKQRFERFSDNKTKFKLVNNTIFENKHVLLIDDVITTGATLEACAHELLKTKNITISIATMAYTQKG